MSRNVRPITAIAAVTFAAAVGVAAYRLGRGAPAPDHEHRTGSQHRTLRWWTTALVLGGASVAGIALGTLIRPATDVDAFAINLAVGLGATLIAAVLSLSVFRGDGLKVASLGVSFFVLLLGSTWSFAGADAAITESEAAAAAANRAERDALDIGLEAGFRRGLEACLDEFQAPAP